MNAPAFFPILLRAVSGAFLLCCASTLSPAAAHAQQEAPDMLLQKARYQQEIRGDVEEAIRLYRSIVDQHADRRDVAAEALLELAEAYEALGREGARDAYDRIVAEFADQVEVARIARSRLAELPEAARVEPIESNLQMRRLWTSPAEVAVAGLSPDGRYAAFVDWGPVQDPATRGHADVAIWDTREASARLVTDRPPLSIVDVYPSTPIWSRDGRRMAYSLWADGWTHMQLRLVRPDGKEDHAILDNQQMRSVEAMAFSSRGDFVVALLQGWDDLYRIGLVRTDHGDLTVLKTLDQHRPTALSLSPDDRFIGYDVLTPGDSHTHDLVALAVDGSVEVPIASHPADDVRAFWTPDGSEVVFTSHRSGRAGLWTVAWSNDAPAGEPALIHDQLGSMNLLGLTASGAPYFLAPTIRSEVHVAELSLEGAGAMGEVSTVPGTHLLTNMRPSWSPDGERIAWLSRRGDRGEALNVVIEDLGTGNERAYPPPFSRTVRETRVDWSADGGHLLIEGGGGTGRDSYRMDAATGEVVREEYRRDWAGTAGGEFRFADGRQAAALRELGIRIIGQTDVKIFEEGDARLRQGEELLWVRNGVRRIRSFAGRDVEDLTPVGHTHAWSLSPDGRTLALAVAEDSVMESNVLYVLPLGGGDLRDVVKLERPVGAEEGAEITVVQWSPDGSHLIYAVQGTGDPRSAEIWTVPAVGGSPRRLDIPLTAHQLASLRFHPDGRRVAFDVVENQAELWLAEGFPWQIAARR